MLGELKDFYPIILNGSAYKTITKLLSERLRDGLHTKSFCSFTGLSSRVPLGTSMECGFGTCRNSSALSAEGGILVSNSDPPCRKQEFHWNTGDKAPNEITKNALLLQFPADSKWHPAENVLLFYFQCIHK